MVNFFFNLGEPEATDEGFDFDCSQFLTSPRRADRAAPLPLCSDCTKTDIDRAAAQAIVSSRLRVPHGSMPPARRPSDSIGSDLALSVSSLPSKELSKVELAADFLMPPPALPRDTPADLPSPEYCASMAVTMAKARSLLRSVRWCRDSPL